MCDDELRYEVWWALLGHYNAMGIVPPGGMVERMADLVVKEHRSQEQEIAMGWRH